MTQLRINLLGVFESRGEATVGINSPGDAVLISRGRPRWLLLRCPCGCGDELPINLDRRAGKAWRLYERDGSITLYPSVWRDTGCESHFIVWKGEILLFGRPEDDLTSARIEVDVEGIASRILHGWPSGQWESYLAVSERIGEIPWDVLDACRHLTRKGALFEGTDKRRGMFLRR